MDNKGIAGAPAGASNYPPPMTPAPAGYPPPGQQGYAPPQPYGPSGPAVPPKKPLFMISPEDLKKVKRMQRLNFAFTMIQLLASVAIICVVRFELSAWIKGFDWHYVCLASTPGNAWTCSYAYALAGVSIFFGFWLSLLTCCTLDCCGMGRALEAAFDLLACVWWVAGAAVLGQEADQANRMGIPQQPSRNAVVALSAICAAVFFILLIINAVLMKRMGKAYKSAKAQMQQQFITDTPVAHPPQYTVAPAGAFYQPQPQWGAAPPAAAPTTGQYAV